MSRPKGGTVEYRSGPQYKPTLWGKNHGELYAKSNNEHGIGPYSKEPMRFVHIEKEVTMEVGSERRCYLSV